MKWAVRELTDFVLRVYLPLKRQGSIIEETHISLGHGHYSQLMTVGEGRNMDRLVNEELCIGRSWWSRRAERQTTADADLIRSSITQEKNLRHLHLGQDLPIGMADSHAVFL